jgi:hypothetical protein
MAKDPDAEAEGHASEREEGDETELTEQGGNGR